LIEAGFIQLNLSPCGVDEHDEDVSKIVAFTYNVKILERGITESGRRDRGRMFVGFTTMQSVSFNTDVVMSNLDQSEVCNIM
jgi:hypothetical protein